MDAFTSEVCEGNPAAVLLMPPSAFYKANATKWMQRVAIENNLSETAYLTKRINSLEHSADVVEYDMRWFSPGTVRVSTLSALDLVRYWLIVVVNL